MTLAVRTAGARAAPVHVLRGASEPETKVWDTMMSSPWYKMVIMSPLISVARPSWGVEMIFERHWQIVQISKLLKEINIEV